MQRAVWSSCTLIVSCNYEAQKRHFFDLGFSHTDFAAGSIAGKLRHGFFRAAYQFLGGPRQIGC